MENNFEFLKGYQVVGCISDKQDYYLLILDGTDADMTFLKVSATTTEENASNEILILFSDGFDYEKNTIDTVTLTEDGNEIDGSIVLTLSSGEESVTIDGTWTSEDQEFHGQGVTITHVTDIEPEKQEVIEEVPTDAEGTEVAIEPETEENI